MSIYTIYGRPKVGKTTLALKDAPKGKTAILSADQGLIGIETKGFSIEEDMSAKNLNKLMNGTWLSKHDRFVVDTATSLHGAMLQELSGGGQVTKQHYGIANNALATLVRTLRDSKKQTIVLAQEKLILPDEDWASDDEDEETSVMTTVDLSPGAASALLQMSDVIGRLYIANVNDKPVRRLWLGPSSSIVSGARSKTYKGNPPYLKQPTIGRLDTLLGWTR